MKKTNEEEQPDVVELYPSELNEVKMLSARLQKKYGFKSFDAGTREQFEKETVESFAELGIKARVTWRVDVSGGADKQLFHVPTVEVVGRVSKEQIDHERYQREVVSGELDGVVGYVREDGSRREDPRKKQL